MSEGGQFTLRFVLPRGKNETTCSELLNDAFQKCQEQDIAPTWISHDEALDISPLKQDVFVIDPFEGEAFKHLSKFKCTIVGPRCLVTCLDDGCPVPELPYPMFTAAMRGLIITSTGFDKDTRNKIQSLVENMGGIYANAFHDGVTHLVCEVVRSKKYDVAVQKEVPIMTLDWIEKVWEIGKHENIKADDKRFLRFSCPALKGLVICISQMSKKDKDSLRKKIESHGGIYSATLDMDKTAILIVTSTEGDKYAYARKWQIPCLSPDWIFDSIDQRQCLATSDYRIDKAKASTPTKDETMKLQDVSACSIIMGPNNTSGKNMVNETALPANSTVLNNFHNPDGQSEIERMLEKLDVGRVKKAGLFLEGCHVYLSGFGEKQEVQLSRVLQSAGAIHIKQITPSLTHMILASSLSEQDLSTMKEVGSAPFRLSLNWIVESMLLAQPAKEEEFIFQESLSTSKRKPNRSRRVENTSNETTLHPHQEENLQSQYERELLAQYGNGNKSCNAGADDTVTFKAGKNENEITKMENEANENTETEEESQVERFLNDKKVAIVGFDEETEADLSDWVNEAGGEFVFRDFAGILDFLILPIFTTGDTCGFKAKEVVSRLWLEDSLDQGQLLPVQYFHRPIMTNLYDKPCEGVVIGITNYIGREREFIAKLAEQLGMISQEIFAKRDKRDAKQSTHLVCANPEGAKYEAAIKWGLPVVTKDWLLSCHKDKTWVSEKQFLVGKATVFTEGKPETRLENVEEKKVVAESAIDEINFKTPNQTSHRIMSRMSIETPGMDIEKLRPKPIEFNADDNQSPYHMMPESQPSPGFSQQPGQNQQGSLKRKRKNDSSASPPFHLQNIKTPETPYGAFGGQGNPTPNTRKMVKMQLDGLSRYQTEDNNTPKRRRKYEADVEENDHLGMKNMEVDEKIVRENHEKFKEKFNLHSHQDFDEAMEEKLKKKGKSWKDLQIAASASSKKSPSNSDGNNKILRGVIVYVAKKLKNVQEELYAIVASLGGEFTWNYNDSVTHFIFSGQVNDRTKEFRQARDDLKKIVSPEWITMCRDEKRRVEEGAFPHSYNPRLTLNISVTSSTSPKTRTTSKTKKSVETDTAIEEEEEDDDEDVETDVVLSSTLKKTKEKPDEVSVQINKLNELVKSSDNNRESLEEDGSNGKNRRSIKLTLTSELTNKTTETATVETVASAEKPKTTMSIETANKTAAAVKSATPSQPAVSAESQFIHWNDPKEENERVKLKERLTEDSQELRAQMQDTFQSMEIPENLTELMSNKENSKNTDNSTLLEGEEEKYFMFSSVPDDVRQKFIGFLEKRNVKYSNITSCDPRASCIIAQKLSRSEKMLGSIASGKLVLHPSYIDSCLAVDKLLPLQRFEWGNPENGFVKNEMSDLEKKLAAASFRWHHLIKSGSRSGAFSGINAIVHTGKNRFEPFRRLLELGDGKVLSHIRSPYSDPENATHCLAEPNKMPNIKIDFASLANNGVPVVGLVYLNEFLVNDPPPKVDSFLVEDFKPFWNKRKVTY